MMLHTPTPWFVHDFTGLGINATPRDVTISCDHPATITVAYMGNALTSTIVEARANARFIVTAVNAHEALVAALRAVKDQPGFEPSEPYGQQVRAALLMTMEREQ